MSQAVRREDRPVRLVGALAVACCALGGCSADLDRWKTTSFGSGYGAGQTPSAPVAEKVAERPVPAYTASRASETYQLRQEVKQDLGGTRQNVNAGYLQVARVDLPPLQNNGTATVDAGRKQYADGYGRYNQPPLADGEYAGPRVVAPYYGPRDGNPPPPPPADWKNGEDEAPPAYRDRPYDDRFPRGGTYEPVPERRYGALPPPPPPPPPGKYDDRLPRGYDGPYGRDSYRGPGGYE